MVSFQDAPDENIKHDEKYDIRLKQTPSTNKSTGKT